MDEYLFDDKKVNHLEIRPRIGHPGEIDVELYEENNYLGKEIRPGGDLMFVALDLITRGWQVRHLKKENLITAHIGRPTRVDFFHVRNNNYLISVYCHGWTAKTLPMRKYNADINLKEELAKLQKMGWSFVDWNWNNQSGARAFLGEPMPVRTKYRIMNLREYWGHPRQTAHLTETQILEFKHMDLRFQF